MMKNDKSGARRPGRPRNEGLRKEILRAARRLFLIHGRSVSLDAIASEADTSKVTLYTHFPSKEELLNAMLIEDVTSVFSLAVDQLDVDDPQSALMSLAEKYLGLVLGREAMENVHVLIVAPRLDLNMHFSFWELGPKALTTALGKYLARVPQLSVEDPEAAAEQFLAMLRGNEQLRLILGLPLRRNQAKRHAYTERCVAAFVRGYARDRGSKS